MRRRWLEVVATVAALALLVAPVRAQRPPRLSEMPRYDSVRMLRHVETFDGFEKPELESFWSVRSGARAVLTQEHVTEGTQALAVTFAEPDSVLRYSRTGLEGWGSRYSRSLTVLGARFIFYNEFKFDVHNTAADDVSLRVTIGGPFDFVLKPGPNTVTIPTTDLARFVYRMTDVTRLMEYSVPGRKDVTLVFDNFRLERESIGPTMAVAAKCFDFGPEDMCRPGFRPVDHHTGYDSTRGYGWERPNLNDEPGSLRTVESDGRNPLGDLLRDGVADLNSSFMVDLPNGRYRVLLVGGYRWGGIYETPPMEYDFVVRAEGEVRHLVLRAGDQAERVKRFYGHDMTDYFFDEDIWTLFGVPVYGPVTFETEVTDGQLNLEFQTSPRAGQGYLNFMVVYPASQSGPIERELGRLWYDVRNRYCRVSYRPLGPELAAQLRPPGVHPEMLAPELRNRMIDLVTSRDDGPSSRDLLFFHRPITNPVYPDTVPRPEEITRDFSAVGFPGQTVSLVVNMFALRELSAVGLELTRLYGPGGRALGESSAELRVVRFEPRMTGQRYSGDWQYMIVPWYLVKRDRIDLDRGMCRTAWIDVHLPESLPAGTYSGYVKFALPGDRTTDVRLAVEVLPRVERVPDPVDRAMVFQHQPGDRGNEPYGYSAYVQNTSGLPRAHAVEVRKLFGKLNQEEMSAEMELLRRSGFSTLYYSDWLDDVVQANKGQERPFKLVEALPLRRRFVTRRVTRESQSYSLYVDPETSTAFLRQLPAVNEEQILSLKKEGLKVYLGAPDGDLYMHESTAVHRYITGLYLWRMGLDGVVLGPFRSNWGDPYNPFDGASGEPGSFALPSSTDWPRPNPSVQLEAVREGATDYDLIRTLEAFIRANPTRPGAREARDFLVSLRGQIDPNLSACVRRVGYMEGWDLEPDAPWTGQRFDEVRRQLIEHIYALSRVTSMPP